jgi:hypothetical protein
LINDQKKCKDGDSICEIMDIIGYLRSENLR